MNVVFDVILDNVKVKIVLHIDEEKAKDMMDQKEIDDYEIFIEKEEENINH